MPRLEILELVEQAQASYFEKRPPRVQRRASCFERRLPRVWARLARPRSRQPPERVPVSYFARRLFAARALRQRLAVRRDSGKNV